MGHNVTWERQISVMHLALRKDYDLVLAMSVQDPQAAVVAAREMYARRWKQYGGIGRIAALTRGRGPG